MGRGPGMTWHVSRRGTCSFAVLLTLGMFFTAASAQEDRGAVGGAGMLSIQRGHRQGSGPSLPTAGAEGTAPGATIEAGGFLSRRVAIGAEVSIPLRFTSTQQTNYLRVFQQESRHREIALSGVLRWTIGSSGPVRWNLVGGGGLVQESTRQRRREQEGLFPTFPPVFEPYSAEYAFTRWTGAALAGFDVEVAVTPRVAIVPQMRVHFVRRSSDASEPGWALGLDSVVLRPAIGVRATF